MRKIAENLAIVTGLFAINALGGCVSQPTEASKNIKVFILAGQSNMDGRGNISHLAEMKSLPRDSLIKYKNPAYRGEADLKLLEACEMQTWKTVELGYSVPPSSTPDSNCKTSGFGPEIGFSRFFDERGESIAIVKFTEGGTNLREDWNPANPDGMYPQFIPFVKNSVAELVASGYSVEVSGLMWHQGEGDAIAVNTLDLSYGSLLLEFFEKTRTDLGTTDLPILVGELFQNGARHERLISIQRDIAAAHDNIFFVSSDELTTQDSQKFGGVHFDSESTIEIGKRFATVWWESVQERNK